MVPSPWDDCVQGLRFGGFSGGLGLTAVHVRALKFMGKAFGLWSCVKISRALFLFHSPLPSLGISVQGEVLGF